MRVGSKSRAQPVDGVDLWGQTDGIWLTPRRRDGASLKFFGGIVMFLGLAPLLLLRGNGRMKYGGLVPAFVVAVLVILILVGATVWTIGYSRGVRRSGV